MAVPGDADTVLKAIHLGWCMSEVRGRNRPNWTPDMTAAAPGGAAASGAAAAAGTPGVMPGWGFDRLPLGNEFTLPQLRVEAQAVLGKLASDFRVNNPDDGRPGSYSDRVNKQAEDLADAKPDGVVQQWEALAGLILDFDLHIQNTFALGSATVACGYQLGRALADCYWALTPTVPEDPNDDASWSPLLSSERCSETERLLGRLSAYFHPYTAAAIAGSVQVWGTLAATKEWRAVKNSYPMLYKQIRGWYQLVLLKQDPTTLIQPYQLLKHIGLIWRAVRMFWAQLVLAALSAAALAFFAWLLSRPGVNSGITTLLGALGITGVSVAGLAAKLKNDAQVAITRIKQDGYTDLIAVAITTAPPPPKTVQAPRMSGPFRPRTNNAKIASIMQQRKLTPVTPD